MAVISVAGSNIDEVAESQSLVNASGFLRGFTSDPGFGYIAGGADSASPDNSVGAVDRFSYQTETVVVLSNGLAVATQAAAGFQSTNDGFIAGGSTNGTFFLDKIEKLSFFNETSKVISSTLDDGNTYAVGLSSSVCGYIAGGYVSATLSLGSQKIEKLVFADENVSLLAQVLPVNTVSGAAFMSENAGYIGGNFAGEPRIQKLQFSDDSTSLLAAELSVAKNSMGAVMSSTHGYFIGGSDTAPGTVEKFSFSTETMTSFASSLSPHRKSFATFSSLTNGYSAGGITNEDALVSTVSAISFSNDAFNNGAGTISTARYNSTGLSCLYAIGWLIS